MLEWLERAESDRVFLDDGARQLKYGQFRAQVEANLKTEVVILRPGLDIESVVDLYSAATGGTAVLLGPRQPDPGTLDPTTAATVIYTSGTTAEPKGVRLTQANWEAAGTASIQHLGHGPDDIWLLAMPLHHVAGLGVILRSACAGGAVRLLEDFDAAEYSRALHQVTMASVVPTMLIRVLDTDYGPYEGLKAVLVGGGPIPDDLLERAHEAGIPALPTYGMTETCGQVATLRPGSLPVKKAHPLPGVEIRIRDDGRILVKGDMVSPGYLGETDRDPNDWFITGDLGRLDDEGALKVSGRADDVIITGGENVSPTELEAALVVMADVENAVAVGLPDEEWGSIVGLAYAGSVGPTEMEIRLRKLFPPHMVPRRLERLDVIPTVAPEKPDRAAVRALLKA